MPFKRLVLLLWWIMAGLFQQFVHAQSTYPDSLKSLLTQDPSPTDKIDLLNTLALYYDDSQPELAFHYLQEVLKVKTSSPYPKGETLAFSILANHYLDKGNFDSARICAERSLRFESQLPEDTVILGSYGAMTSYHIRTGSYAKGKEWALKGIDKSIALKSWIEIALFYNQAGVAEYYMGNLQGSMDYYKNALAIMEYLDDFKGVNMSIVNIGVIYFQLGLMEEALAMFIRSKEIQEENNMKSFIPSTYLNIADTYLELADLPNAKTNYLQSRQEARELNQPQVEGQALAGLAKYYLEQDSLDKALEYASQGLEIHRKMDWANGIAETGLILAKTLLLKGDYQQAQQLGQRSYDWAKESGSDAIAKEAAVILSESHSQLGNYQKAVSFFQELRTLEDSLLGAEKIKEATRMAAEYEFKRKQELQTLAQQRKDGLAKADYDRQVLLRNLFLLGLGVMVLIVISVFLAYRRIRQINANVSRQSQEISFLNQNLEKLVTERTEELKEKNLQITEYIFTNSHRVRGPIARILGLLQLKEAGQFPSLEEKEQLFVYIHRAAKEADEVVFEIGKKLEAEEEPQGGKA